MDPTNNPMQLEQYNSISSTDIRSGGYTIQNLITRQLERIDFMLTLGTAKISSGTQYFDEKQMASAVQRGLRSVESYLYSFVQDDEEYLEQSKQLKTIINSSLKDFSNNQTQLFNALADWQDLLISRMGNVDLLPQKRTEIEFD